MTEPDAPQDVRLQYADGSTSEPLPLLYLGIELAADSSVDVWEALAPDSRPAVAMLVGTLPPRSTIRIAVA